jgi:hypothetical protein
VYQAGITAPIGLPSEKAAEAQPTKPEGAPITADPAEPEPVGAEQREGEGADMEVATAAEGEGAEGAGVCVCVCVCACARHACVNVCARQRSGLSGQPRQPPSPPPPSHPAAPSSPSNASFGSTSTTTASNPLYSLFCLLKGRQLQPRKGRLPGAAFIVAPNAATADAIIRAVNAPAGARCVCVCVYVCVVLYCLYQRTATHRHTHTQAHTYPPLHPHTRQGLSGAGAERRGAAPGDAVAFSEDPAPQAAQRPAGWHHRGGVCVCVCVCVCWC